MFAKEPLQRYVSRPTVGRRPYPLSPRPADQGARPVGRARTRVWKCSGVIGRGAPRSSSWLGMILFAVTAYTTIAWLHGRKARMARDDMEFQARPSRDRAAARPRSRARRQHEDRISASKRSRRAAGMRPSKRASKVGTFRSISAASPRASSSGASTISSAPNKASPDACPRSARTMSAAGNGIICKACSTTTSSRCRTATADRAVAWPIRPARHAASPRWSAAPPQARIDRSPAR